MSDEYLRRDTCPTCGAPVSAAEATIRSTPPAEILPFGSHGAFLSGYTGRRVFFTYHRCRVCRGLYCPIYFTPAQLDQLYGHQRENMAEVPLPAREATHRAYFELLRPHASLDGEYLELGPDIGLFTQLCVDHGRFTRVHLFEPNREVHSSLSVRMAERDAHISAEPYRTGALSGQNLSVAVLIHVLDHLIDPTVILEALHADLRPGGTVFIVTHDEASIMARVLGRRWPPYTLQHPQLFAPHSIARLLERCRFSVVDTRKTVNYFPATHLLRSIFTVAGFERLAPRFDHPLTVGVKLGNIATIARKPA